MCSQSKNDQIWNGGGICQRNERKNVMKTPFLAVMKGMSMLKRQHLYCTREIQTHNFLLYISMLQPCQEPGCGTVGG